MSLHRVCVQRIQNPTSHRSEHILQFFLPVTSHFGQLRYRSTISATTTSQSLNKTESLQQTAAEASRPPPHSLLPTHMLLRSLLVSTISSSPFLLSSSLRFMTLVTNKRLAVFDVNKNPILYALLKKTFYEHFCAGENHQEVKSTVQSIKDIGCKGVILTYAREIVVDETKQERGLGSQAIQAGSSDLGDKEKYADIDTWKSGVLGTLGMLSSGDVLALKFTGAGEAVAQSLRARQPFPQAMQEALDTICRQALQNEVRIFVDAEQQSLQGAIDVAALDLMRKYNAFGERALIYNTYQMYLKSSVANLNNHLEQATRDKFTLGVKLVRGAYMSSEPRHVIQDTKEDTDRAYDQSMKAMIEQSLIPVGQDSKQNLSSIGCPSVSLFVATHNRDSSLYAVNWYQDRLSRNLPSVKNIDFGQLLGMADGVSCELLQIRDEASASGSRPNSKLVKPNVYKCLSWGTLEDCLSYLLRRVVENREAVLRTKSEAIGVRKEVWRRLKSSLGLAR